MEREGLGVWRRGVGVQLGVGGSEQRELVNTRRPLKLAPQSNKERERPGV